MHTRSRDATRIPDNLLGDRVVLKLDPRPSHILDPRAAVWRASSYNRSHHRSALGLGTPPADQREDVLFEQLAS